MKLDGIDGECQSADHKDTIELQSWSHGFSQPTSSVRASNGATIERAHHSDINITKYLDKATDGILKAIWSGKQIKDATISCYRADGNVENKPIEYLTIKIEGVIIANYSISGGAGDLPFENISLNYGKVTYTYKPQKSVDGNADSQVVTSADLVTGQIS